MACTFQDPLELIKKIDQIQKDTGFYLNYDSKDKKFSLWARLPKKADYIEIIFPSDFDVKFRMPQFIEVNSITGSIKKCDIIFALDSEDMMDEIKKIIITILIKDNDYCFNNLKLLTGKDRIMGDFIFKKDNDNFSASLFFTEGNVNILIFPSVLIH